MSLSQYATAHGYRLTTDILICVFNTSTNTYEYTTSVSDIGRVAAEVADEILVQLAYAIGVAEPVGIYVNTYGTAKIKNGNNEIMTDGEIAEKINNVFDLRPNAIVKRFGLKNPIFLATATWGHVGRTNYKKEVTVFENEKEIKKEVEFFAWEKLDYVDKIKQEFNL